MFTFLFAISLFIDVQKTKCIRLVLLKKAWKFFRSYQVSYFKVNICISYIIEVLCLGKIKQFQMAWSMSDKAFFRNSKKYIFINFVRASVVIYFQINHVCFYEWLISKLFCLKNICIFNIFWGFSVYNITLHCYAWTLTVWLFQTVYKIW